MGSHITLAPPPPPSLLFLSHAPSFLPSYFPPKLSTSTSLRQRKGSEESMESGRETSSGDSGFSNSVALKTIQESEDSDSNNISDIISLHSTTV